MNVMVPIPDELAARFGSEAELGRRAVEALALEEYRAGRLTRPELGRLLGFLTTSAIENFLNTHGIEARAGDQHPADAGHDDSVERAQASELVERFRAFRAGKTLGGLDIKELIAEGRR
ncbi:MAG: hypothetical protein JOY71_19200 [Acetobacteraceae bacterium]|nr:hypothetical protein [Acetobacteraceae bacterium]